MQITIDSTEPLDKVLTVVGALYGVTLGETTGGLVGRGSPNTEPRAAMRKAKQGRVTAAGPKKTGRSKRSVRRASEIAPDPASVRIWAKANGHRVRDRGPVPASAIAAYLAAGAPDA